jgi:flagellar basal body rod protein FlgG
MLSGGMSIAIHTGASHLSTLEHWQSVAAHNLANSSMPGFQASTFSVESVQPGAFATELNGQAVRHLLQGQSSRSMGSGEVKITGNPNDLAIQGAGYFSIRDEAGEINYTRNGEFHVDATGRLVNAQGFPLLAAGAPIQINVQDGPYTVAQDGTVSQNGQQLAQISLYTFDNPEALNGSIGSAMVDPERKAMPRILANPVINQGQLEMSNVVPMREMISMIELSRAYEIAQKSIQSADERQDKAIQTFTV